MHIKNKILKNDSNKLNEKTVLIKFSIENFKIHSNNRGEKMNGF